MILRASPLNSPGGVATSRSWRRLPPTSGWLLTLSDKAVPLDQPPHRINRDLEHAVHVRRVEVVDLSRAKFVDAQVDRARPQLAQPRYDEEGGRLHVVAQDSSARPHLQLVAKVRARHAVGHEVRVERVDGSNHTDVKRNTRGARRLDQRVDHVK